MEFFCAACGIFLALQEDAELACSISLTMIQMKSIEKCNKGCCGCLVAGSGNLHLHSST